MFKLVTVEMLKETQDKIIIDNTPSLSTVMTVGNTANMELNMASNAIINVGDISGQTINLNTSSLKLNGEVGSPGKILTVNLLGKPSWGESKKYYSYFGRCHVRRKYSRNQFKHEWISN